MFFRIYTKSVWYITCLYFNLDHVSIQYSFSTETDEKKELIEQNSKSTAAPEATGNEKGKYNMDFLDDLSNMNPFETKTKINTSIHDSSNITNITGNKTSDAPETEPKYLSLNNDIRDDMLSPVDLPNLELIASPENTKSVDSESLPTDNPDVPKCTKNAITSIETLSELKKPTSIDLNKSTSPTPRRKISTPEFEEAERRFMMDEVIKPSAHDSPKFNLNARSSKLADELEKESKSEKSNLEHRLSKEFEEVKHGVSNIAPEKPAIMAIPNDDMPPSIFSPAPSSLYESHAKKDIKEMHTHWDEYKSVEDEKPKTETSKSGQDFVRMDLHYQATLLEKDKLLHDKEKEIQNLDQDISILKMEMGTIECNNKGMLKVVNEYEKTISEVISDRERDRVCHDIAKEKLKQERDQTMEDLHSAERAFNDVHRYIEHILVHMFH